MPEAAASSASCGMSGASAIRRFCLMAGSRFPPARSGPTQRPSPPRPLFPAEQTRIVKLLVEKVIVSPNDLEVRLRANGIERLVLELRPEPDEQQAEALA